MTTPAMSASLAANCNPLTVDLGSFLGKATVTGVVSGLGMWQDPVNPGDRSEQADLSNGQVFIQKTDGLLQYYIQAGIYSIPVLGATYVSAEKLNHQLFGPLPVAYLKLAPSDTFSVQIGKLPTIIGAEYVFDFENLNIQRGLLWNQEPAVSKGVQVNYTMGPVAASISWNDGLYSNRFNWISGLLTWTIDSSNILAFDGGANLGHTGTNTFATPQAQNNEAIFNVMYTHTEGPWTFNPYFQYTTVDANPALGVTHEENSYAGALLINYAFDSSGPLAGFSLPFRFEYMGTTGSRTNGWNLLYGPNSDAWSLTLTPTYQVGAFFGRGEISYVEAVSPVAGSAFGPNGTDKSQTRLLLEAGVIF
jgi:hypothetical protein